MKKTFSLDQFTTDCSFTWKGCRNYPPAASSLIDLTTFFVITSAATPLSILLTKQTLVHVKDTFLYMYVCTDPPARYLKNSRRWLVLAPGQFLTFQQSHQAVSFDLSFPESLTIRTVCLKSERESVFMYACVYQCVYRQRQREGKEKKIIAILLWYEKWWVTYI